MTGVDLSVDDLIPLKVAGATAPTPLTAHGVPSILTMLQTEWDAVMLDVFTLRKSLTDTRKELAHALYQQDAACRVIARLVKEKEQLQQMLTLTREELDSKKDLLQ